MTDSDTHPERDQPTTSVKPPLPELAPKTETEKKTAIRGLIDRFRPALDALAK